MNKRILDIIESPQDIRFLSDDEIGILAQEIREEIISTTSNTGGHVASSLGTVEIILALHSLMNCPNDKLVFDVGHQAYAHKLLTGRVKEFCTLRQYGGLSGFPKPSESPYDVHPSGHASDSLSVALGLAKARDLRGGDEKIVALIGDASLSGGMAFEALNHIGHDQTRMVIILNDNEMAISRNVGGLMRHLGFLRSSTSYRQTRDAVQEKLENSGKVGQSLASFGRNVKDSMKHLVLTHTMIFEQLGIMCTAPIDGHDYAALKQTLETVFETDGPVLVHVVTRKGAGYLPAEQSPEVFHGIGPYDASSGEVVRKKERALTYTQVFAQALMIEAERNEDVVAITAAMKSGTGLKEFSERYPDRFFDVGIAEAHACGMAAGLAFGGKKPVVALYSTFMQRAVDQIIIDNALCALDVVFCIDRAGLVGDDGPTHHGVFDLVYMRMIPNMKVMTPSNEAELANALHTALSLGGPFAIRYPRGEGEGAALPKEPCILEVGKSETLREGNDVAILAFGRMVSSAKEAAHLLSEQGIEARIVDMRWAKPFDTQAIIKAAETQLVVTVEEGVITGGVGQSIATFMIEHGFDVSVLIMGIEDCFVAQGKTEMLMHDLGIDGQGIASAIEKQLKG